MRQEIADSFAPIVSELCPPDVVRAIEVGGEHAFLWAALEETGFVNALVSEAQGGAGLSLADAAPILELAGEHAVPVPIAETVMLRGQLSLSGRAWPQGSITFGGVAVLEQGKLIARLVPYGKQADHVVVVYRGVARLLAATTAVVQAATELHATLAWTPDAWESSERFDPRSDLIALQALTHALQAAGALSGIFSRTLQYANERVQFGRHIGKFQAVQHQLSVMAEQVFAACMAAELASQNPGDRLRVAIAKARTSQAAVDVAACAHAVHGAIGFTAEYDLQLLTRRLALWRLAARSEAFWWEEIGRILLAQSSPLALDLLRSASETVVGDSLENGTAS